MVGVLFLVAIITTLQKCKSKSSIIIPWKKSASEKDYTTIHIGCSNDCYLRLSSLFVYFPELFCTDPEMLKDVVKYSRQELEVACEDFSNIIGSSPDSHVYKGTLKGGPEIAVISLCVKEEHWTGFLELYFQKEVTIMWLTLTSNHILFPPFCNLCCKIPACIFNR